MTESSHPGIAAYIATRKPTRWTKFGAEVGNSWVVGDCPFCGAEARTTRRSLHGSGKRCKKCGALLGAYWATPAKKKP